VRRQTVNIIEDLVSALDVVFEIDAVIVNTVSYTLESKCTWWLSIGDTVTIDGFDYTIESFVINESITILPVGSSPAPTATSFDISAPNYIHGTLKMAANEVDATLDKTILAPFVYLFEVIRDRKNTDKDSMIDREVDLRIFFLNTANTSDWLTDDHYLNLIDPMQQMVDLFMKNIENNKLFTDELNYDCLPLINVSETGTQEESLFDCNLSGIELRLFAEIRENLSWHQ